MIRRRFLARLTPLFCGGTALITVARLTYSESRDRVNGKRQSAARALCCDARLNRAPQRKTKKLECNDGETERLLRPFGWCHRSDQRERELRDRDRATPPRGGRRGRR